MEEIAEDDQVISSDVSLDIMRKFFLLLIEANMLGPNLTNDLIRSPRGSMKYSSSGIFVH